MRADEFEKINTQAFKELMTNELRQLDKLLTKNGHEVRIVGGAVRDLALHKKPKDIDLSTDATPEEMQDIFDKAEIRYKPTGIEHGTLTVLLDQPYEITTLRADTETDGRHAKIDFVKDWKEDAQRRDLTYNAMSLDFDGKLYDYFGGLDDLQNKVSVFVGDPEERIKEDYLRILRYFRFQSKLNDPKWNDETLDAIKKNADGLRRISVERVWAEVQKTLLGRNASEALKFMGGTGVAQQIGLPVKNAEAITKLERPKSAILPLAVLVDSPELAQTWKMSRPEGALLKFLTKHKHNTLDSDSAEDMLAQGTPKEYVLALLSVQQQPALVDIIRSYKQPEFPVTGKDLLAKGLKPGPEIGKVLNSLKDKWTKSRFKLSKDELLHHLAKNKE